MTNEQNPVNPPAAPEVVKPRRTRRPMAPTRKSDHHAAKAALEAFWKTNPEKAAEWTALYPDTQVRVLSNLLLDYIPGFLQNPFADVAACDELLRKASIAAGGPKAFRKANKALAHA